MRSGRVIRTRIPKAPTLPEYGKSGSQTLYHLSQPRPGPIVDLAGDIATDLPTVYCQENSVEKYAMAVLRTGGSDSKGCAMGDTCDSDHRSVLHPAIPLSGDTVGDHPSDLAGCADASPDLYPSAHPR